MSTLTQAVPSKLQLDGWWRRGHARRAGCGDAVETMHGIGIRMGPCLGVKSMKRVVVKWRPPLWLVVAGQRVRCFRRECDAYI